MDSTRQITARPAFVRDRFTWTAYLLLGYFAYLQALLGPLMPFLRTELNLSYVLGSLHLSAAAAGMVLLGLIGDRLVRRLGARIALWGGAIGMAAGALLLALGTHIAVTIAATAAMGILGSLLLVAQQTSLAQHQREARAIAFTEANIVASLGAMLAPLAVGAGIGAGIGWRAALLLPLPLLATLLLREGSQPVPEPGAVRDGNSTSGRLPLRFWAFWTVACLSVAVEWSIGFWGADYLHTIAGLPLEQAVTAMSIFFLAMLLGRVIGSRLARRFPAAALLSGVLALALAGVALFWQAPSAIFNLIALAIAGLGVGNLFPLTLAAAVESAPYQVPAATARMTLAGGMAILTAPLILGGWADQVGLWAAFGLVPVLLMAALLVAASAGAQRIRIQQEDRQV